MTSAKNTNLNKAKQAKNDEFYTRYEDIEKEVEVYFEYDNNVFKNKTILLPCDDYRWSNFTKYFVNNFERYGLKKLISTHYAKDGDIAYKFVYNGLNKIIEPLEGNGDFRSEEVTKLRDECDVIVTNPPFSLARSFISWIMEADKKFLIIINSNAITYKEVFPLLKNNDIWLGCHNVKEFKKPNGEYQKFGNICWFTNLDHDKRHEKLSLMTVADNLKYNKKLIKKLKNDYGTETYPKYDNYDAIEVPYTDAIPSDYKGVMGVPISFMDKYSDEQFELISYLEPVLNKKELYKRLLIKRRDD